MSTLRTNAVEMLDGRGKGAITFDNVQEMKDSTVLLVGQKVRTLGYYSVGDGGGNDYEIVADSTGADDGGSFIDLPGSGLQAKGLFPVNVTDVMFGVVKDAASPQNFAINAARDYCKNNDRVLDLAPGTILLGVDGQINSRNYGFLVDSNVHIRGASPALCSFRADDSTDMDVITTPRVTSISNLRLENFTVDGNTAGQGPTAEDPDRIQGGMNMWIQDVDGFHMDNVFSLDSSRFGFRLKFLTNFFIGTLQTDHGPYKNTDGFHLKDSNSGVINKVIVYTQGDDGFIINAEDDDVHDISIGEVVIHTPVFVAAGRGIYISNAVGNVEAGVQRKIYNINIANAVTYNCDATALQLWYADFYNININHVDYGSVVGVGFQLGGNDGIGVAGSIRNCHIVSSIYEPQTLGVQTFQSNGVMEHCKFDFRVYNPGDGYDAVDLACSDCVVNIQVDYDPLATKTNKLRAFQPATGTTFKNNIVTILAKGADKGIRLTDSNATGNTFYLGSLENDTYDVELLTGADNNTFVGGSITLLRNVASGSSFSNVRGAYGRGRLTVSPDASGEASFPHGLVDVPRYIQASYSGGSGIIALVRSPASTNITVQLRDFTGSAITTGSHQVNWEASL